MLSMDMTGEELNHLKRLLVSYRRDRKAVFSVNSQERTWPFATWGPTPEARRKHIVRGSEKLRVIACELLRVRPEGGRFFLDRTGAYYKGKDRHRIYFARFRFANAPRVFVATEIVG